MALDRRGRKLFVTDATTLVQIKTGSRPPRCSGVLATGDTTVDVAVRGKPASRPPRAPCP